MNAKITSYKLDVYVEYSYFNLVIFMALFLSSGIPVLIPLAWVSLVTKYITNRILLQSVSSRIEGLT